MSHHLEIRNTPYGRILVAVEPEPGITQEGPPAENGDVRVSPHPPELAAAEAPGVAASIRAALARIGRRPPSPLDDQKHHLRTETQEIMDRVSTAIEALFDDYLQHPNESTADATEPAAHHEESTHV